MALLKTKGLGGELLVPEHSDPEWVSSVIEELKTRLELLEDAVDESGYRLHEECKTLVDGLQIYHGGQ